MGGCRRGELNASSLLYAFGCLRAVLYVRGEQEGGRRREEREKKRRREGKKKREKWKKIQTWKFSEKIKDNL
jgi:hypothetical protein